MSGKISATGKRIAAIALDSTVDFLPPIDMNSDGFLDVLVAEYRKDGTGGTTHWLYYGKADGSLSAGRKVLPASMSVSRSLVLDDFDGDGRIDLGFSSDEATPVTIVLLNPFLPKP
jgi:hypothetical protein